MEFGHLEGVPDRGLITITIVATTYIRPGMMFQVSDPCMVYSPAVWYVYLHMPYMGPMGYGASIRPGRTGIPAWS